MNNIHLALAHAKACRVALRKVIDTLGILDAEPEGTDVEPNDDDIGPTLFDPAVDDNQQGE